MCELLVNIGLCAALLPFAATDIRSRQIRWPPAACIAAAGVLLRLLPVRSDAAAGAGFALGGLAVGAVFLAITLLMPSAAGPGDAVVTAACGPWIGPEGSMELLFLAFLMASVWSLILLVIRRAGRKSSFPFVPFLLAAQICRTVVIMEQLLAGR